MTVCVEAAANMAVERPESEGLFTVVVVGAGLTGIEAAREMPERLRAILARAGLSRPFHVILTDHHPRVGSVIEEVLTTLGIEMRLGIDVVAISPAGITFASGEEIAAATVVWCAGMRASPSPGCSPSSTTASAGCRSMSSCG